MSAPRYLLVRAGGALLSFALVVALFALMSPSAWAANSYVRVSLVGYEQGVSAEADLMTTSTVSGETFKVINSSGEAVSSGNVAASSGTWGSYTIYPITFTVSSAGSYTVSVKGTVSATSPRFPVAKPPSLYTEALENTLYFYQNERDGADYVPTALRTAPGHL